MSTHFESGHRTARKRHTCDLCLQPIEPGWIYDYTNAIGENGPYTWKSHPACLAVYRQWNCDDQEDFCADDYIANGYAWPKHGPDGHVIEYQNTRSTIRQLKKAIKKARGEQ